MKIFVSILIMFFGLVSVQSVARVMAEPSTGKAATPYETSGVVQHIDVPGRTIVVNNKRYFFASATVSIRRADGEPYSRKLKENTLIGFNTSKDGPNQSPNVTEIWVLEEPKP